MRNTTTLKIVVLLVLCMQLAGCWNPRERIRTIATARPIDPGLLSCSGQASTKGATCPIALAGSTTGNLIYDLRSTSGQKNYLGLVVYDSLSSCSDFMDGLVKNQSDVNFYGDSVSTIFTAWSTIATPLSTIHALAGAATVVSGSKNAFLSGFYAKAAASSFGSAVVGSYYKVMGSYMDQLESKSDGIIVPIELARIESIHSMCSLMSMESTIQATLNSARTSQTASGIEVSIAFDKSAIKPGESTAMTVGLENGTGKDATLSADFSASLSSTVHSFSPKSSNLSSDCNANPGISLDGKSIIYSKGTVIPADSCKITLVITTTTSDSGTITGSAAAGALDTTQGSNEKAASASLQVSSNASVQQESSPGHRSTGPIHVPPPGASLQTYQEVQQP